MIHPGGVRLGRYTAAMRASRVAAGMVAAAVVVALAAGASGGATNIARVDEYIDAPRALLGETRDDVLRALGPPVDRDTRRRATFRDPTVSRTVERLRYPGLAVELAGRLVRVELTAPLYRLPWGLDVGVRREALAAALGEPEQASDTRVRYLYSDGFPKTVTFHIDDGVVRRIDWEYWLE